jgi:hypothetical protein
VRTPADGPVVATGRPSHVALGAIGLAAGSALGLVLLAVTLPGHGVSTFVVRVAELALAGGAAYLIDDATAAVTVTTPRTVWRRRAPRLARGLGVLGLAWVVILLVLRWQDNGQSGLWLTIEVTVLCALALAVSAVLTRQGDPEPGGQAAPAVILMGLAAVICEPLLNVSVFVPDGGADQLVRQSSWLVAGAVAALVVVLASRDPAGARRPVRSDARR